MSKIIKQNKTILYLISMLAYAMFLIPQDVLGIGISLFLIFIFALIVLIKKNKLSNDIETKKVKILSGLILTITFLVFINRWPNSDRFFSIASKLKTNVYFLVIVIGTILFLLSITYVYTTVLLLSNLLIHNNKSNSKKENSLVRKKETYFILVCSIAIITICSKSSFLYPINDWADSNVYFTIGKSVLHGKVIYRDLFDHKGPLIYFIHTLASIISNRSFIGMYFIEIIACFFFLLYLYKCIKLYLDKDSIILIPLISLLVYTAKAFCHGDSAEELCLPLITYAIYISLKTVKTETIPSRIECFLIGFFAGCIFWTKFTLVGCFIGIIIVPSIMLIEKKQISTLLKEYLYIAVGVAVSTIPYVLYFGLNNAINNLIEVYFYDNLFGYPHNSGTSFLSKILYGIEKGYVNVRTYNEIIGILIILGLLWVYLTKETKEFLHIFFVSFMSFFFTYVGGKGLAYYSLILSPLAIWGFILVFQTINSVNTFKTSKTALVLSFILLLVFSTLLTPNRYMILEKKENTPQYKFEKIINEYDNPTLINYKFLDGGFYTVTGIIPNCKSFCLTNFPSKELSVLQDEFCEKGKCNFIVSRNLELSFDKYEKISECTHYYERNIYTYYLYKLKTIK